MVKTCQNVSKRVKPCQKYGWNVSGSGHQHVGEGADMSETVMNVPGKCQNMPKNVQKWA